MSRLLTSLYWAVLLSSCYDAPRTNPFDSALTPPVELQVALDDTAGTATLTWSQYEGKQPFREYQVLRKVPGLEKVDTLAHLPAVEQTTFVDTTLAPDTDYLYRVSVVNSGGFEVPSQEEEARPFNLPVVQLIEAQWDSRTAMVALRWTAYRGPRFKAYRLERRTTESAVQVVKEVVGLADTAYVDSLLVGNTEYFYRVVVLTERGEEVPSAEMSGKFHNLLATWPLELEEGGYVRLYWEEDRLTALLTDPRGVRLRFYEPAGTLRQEQVLLGPQEKLLPRSVATALSSEGRRFLCVTRGNKADGVRQYYPFGVVQFDAEGLPLPVETHLPTDDLPPLNEEFGPVSAPINLSSNNAAFDNLAVFKGDALLFADDFSSGGEKWSYVDPSAVFDAGQVYNISKISPILLSTGDPSWQDPRVEADVVFFEGWGNINLDLGDDSRSLGVYINPVLLGRGWDTQYDTHLNFIGVPFLGFSGISIHLSLAVVDRKVTVAVTSPVLWVLWADPKGLGIDYLGWGSLVLVEGVLGMTEGDQPYSVSQEGKGLSTPVFAEEVSETRSWKAGGEEPRLGICLPLTNQVRIRKNVFIRSPGAIAWPGTSDLVEVGAGAGLGAGELLYPLSFDAGPDGRIYVLDSGNGRIQVFDAEGEYLTQWGRKGNGEGEFDFGSGRVPEDFVGSVAVDDEGYIYVADVGNKRIQKFEP